MEIKKLSIIMYVLYKMPSVHLEDLHNIEQILLKENSIIGNYFDIIKEYNQLIGDEPNCFYRKVSKENFKEKFTSWININEYRIIKKIVDDYYEKKINL